MTDKKYEVAFEIAGPAAMFTRPDTGAAPVSYPVPTYSATKGMFEAVARLRSAYIKPLRVEICEPVRFEKYVTNYGGALRKSNQLSEGSSYQLPATILADVCYKIFGQVVEFKPSPNGNNHLHALQEIFMRRLEKGQLFYTPCLGWKEFVPSYFGILRDTTKKDMTINLTIPSILYSVFDNQIDGNIMPEFKQDKSIIAGEFTYD
jgi:CRISPR-associated protein Cas5d